MKNSVKENQSYWSDNIYLIAKCLTVWFISSFLFGIVLVEQLNQFRLGGYKVGFWFAQQGSIYTFVILIFYYAYKIGRIDDRYKNHSIK